jgi:hypothetical protein
MYDTSGIVGGIGTLWYVVSVEVLVCTGIELHDATKLTACGPEKFEVHCKVCAWQALADYMSVSLILYLVVFPINDCLKLG